MTGRWLERNDVPVCQQEPPAVLPPVEHYVADVITRPLDFRYQASGLKAH